MLTIPFYTVVCFDQHGNTFKTVASELGDQVLVHSLTTSDGSPFQFESELYHLREAIENTGIICYINPQEITIDF